MSDLDITRTAVSLAAHDNTERVERQVRGQTEAPSSHHPEGAMNDRTPETPPSPDELAHALDVLRQADPDAHQAACVALAREPQQDPGACASSGFTPLFDKIVQRPELGRTAATVLGKVWRYCNAYGKCTASRENMAQQTGLSSKTFDRWLPRLCEMGYLEDLTPHWRSRPHHYRDTGKVKMPLRAKTGGEADGQSVQAGRTQSPTGTDSKSDKEKEKKENREGESHQGPSGTSLTLPNGRYKGKTLGQILERGDTGYLDWLSKHWGSPNIRRAAADLLARAGITGGGGNGSRRSRHGPRRRREEYPSYSMEKREEAWAQHGDDFRAAVDDGLDPIRQLPKIARRLGVTMEKAYMLRDAYFSELSRQEEPLDPSVLGEGG